MTTPGRLNIFIQSNIVILIQQYVITTENTNFGESNFYRYFVDSLLKVELKEYFQNDSIITYCVHICIIFTQVFIQR